MRIKTITRILISLSFLWAGAVLAGTVMPEAPARPHDIRRPGEFKPVIGQGGNPGFFWIDRDGTMREGGPDEARQGNGCWGSTEVQGLNGPLICCPDDAMRELSRKQKLQCLQPGQNPRELTEQEMGELQFKDGRPVADAAEDCKPFVCDQQCDQQNQPGQQQPRRPGELSERDRWAMDGGEEDDFPDFGTPEYNRRMENLREKQRESQQREAANEREGRIRDAQDRDIAVQRSREEANRSREAVARAQATNEAAKKGLEGANKRLGEAYGSGDSKKIKEAQEKFNQAGQAAREAAENERKAKEAANKAEANKNAQEARARAAAEKREKEKEEKKNKEGTPVDPMWGGGDPGKAHAAFCRSHPEACPSRQEQATRPNENGGGGAPVEDPYGETSQFLCIMDGQRGQGFGNNQGMNAGGNRGSFAGDSREESQRGGCPGGARQEGAGFDGREGQGEAGIDVARGNNCDNSGRGPRLPGDDVINPGDPTFFQCPEMGCPNQRKSSITMNNCPDNSVIGRRSKMSCNPYNGPGGAIDPVRK